MSKGQINQIIIMYSVKGLNKEGSGTINRLTHGPPILKPHFSPLNFFLKSTPDYFPQTLKTSQFPPLK